MNFKFGRNGLLDLLLLLLQKPLISFCPPRHYWEEVNLFIVRQETGSGPLYLERSEIFKIIFNNQIIAKVFFLVLLFCVRRSIDILDPENSVSNQKYEYKKRWFLISFLNIQNFAKIDSKPWVLPPPPPSCLPFSNLYKYTLLL